MNFAESISPETADMLRAVAIAESVAMLVLLIATFFVVLPRVQPLGRIIYAGVGCILLSYGLSVVGNVTEMMHFWGHPPTYRLPIALAVLTFGDFALWLLVAQLFFRTKHFHLV